MSLCTLYEDCPASAFDVVLPPNAFASLYLPGLTDFEITDTYGEGKLPTHMQLGCSAFACSISERLVTSYYGSLPVALIPFG